MGESNIATALDSIFEKVEEAKLKRNMPAQGGGPDISAVSGFPHFDQLSKTNLFIQGLEEDITDMDLLMLCSPYGQIISAKAILDKQTSKCKGYGFVDFESPVAAEIAVRALARQGVQAQMAKVHDVCIVAVSKTKPKSMIIEAYNCGHRDFGENYVNELFEKASDAELLELCPDIRWHFIGHLQSNKVNKLMGVPNLYMLHTVDSVKLADLVDRAWSKLQKPEPLKVMIQVNTSGEESKSGISPDDVLDLAKHIIENCKHVHLAGLMLIGYANYDLTLGPNPEFQLLSKCKISICEKFNINPEDLELSMGMSQDFEHAVELGSNYVRVGSLIFGAREHVSTQ